jgi:DNA polymerase alpha subunit A
LTREPEQYQDSKLQPHVVVALRMKARGLAVRSGDTIPYIICGSARKEGSLSEHAFHPDDVRKEHLQIDTDWYLAQQVHPCVARLCEHLAGTDAGRLASCLGLDASRYHTKPAANGEEEGVRLTAFMNDEEKFRNVEHLMLTCPACRASFDFRGLLVTSQDGRMTSGLDCACGQRVPPISLHYQLLSALTHQVSEYYLGWMDCDEPSCRATTRQPRVYESRCPNDSCRGAMRPRYSGGRLYSQLLYYRSLIDNEKWKIGPEWRLMVGEYEPLKRDLIGRLDKCAYPIINLAEIFSFVKLNSF